LTTGISTGEEIIGRAKVVQVSLNTVVLEASGKVASQVEVGYYVQEGK